MILDLNIKVKIEVSVVEFLWFCILEICEVKKLVLSFRL